MPARALARARAAFGPARRPRKGASPNTPRPARVPNMSPNSVEESMPRVMMRTPRRAPRGPDLLFRDGLVVARCGERHPAAVGELLEGGKAPLVGHLRALGDPVAEIDIGQVLAAA